MAIFSSDTFTDTSGTALGSHTGEVGASWTRHTLFAGSAVISDANRARNSDTADAFTLWFSSGVPGAAEYDVEAPMFVITVISATGLVGRANTATETFYLAHYVATDTTWNIYKAVSASYTQLASAADTLSTSTEYDLKFEIRDATKKLYVDTVEVLSTADNAITAAGRAGIWLERLGDNVTNTAGMHLTSFVANDTTGVTPKSRVPLRRRRFFTRRRVA